MCPVILFSQLSALMRLFFLLLLLSHDSTEEEHIGSLVTVSVGWSAARCAFRSQSRIVDVARQVHNVLNVRRCCSWHFKKIVHSEHYAIFTHEFLNFEDNSLNSAAPEGAIYSSHLIDRCVFSLSVSHRCVCEQSGVDAQSNGTRTESGE